MARIYYHNLLPDVDKSLEDYEFITPYKTQKNIPLLVYNMPENTYLYQFIQGIIPDSHGNRHIFLALKDDNKKVLEKSLWTLKEMEKIVTQTLNKTQ